MKNIIFVLAVHLLFSVQSALFAQENATFDVGSMIWGSFSNETKPYTAEIIESSSNLEFKCRFSHSGSVYKFKFLDAKLEDGLMYVTAVVVSNVGGSYKPGTPFEFTVWQKTTENKDAALKVTFSGRAYLATIIKEDEDNFEVLFVHSYNEYLLGKNGKVVKSGGGYKAGTSFTYSYLKAL